MRAHNKTSKMAGLFDEIRSWVTIAPTAKTTDYAQEKALAYAEQFGLSKLFQTATSDPGTTDKPRAPGELPKIDPKYLIVGGIVLAGVALLLFKKRR